MDERRVVKVLSSLHPTWFPGPAVSFAFVFLVVLYVSLRIGSDAEKLLQAATDPWLRLFISIKIGKPLWSVLAGLLFGCLDALRTRREMRDPAAYAVYLAQAKGVKGSLFKWKPMLVRLLVISLFLAAAGVAGLSLLLIFTTWGVVFFGSLWSSARVRYWGVVELMRREFGPAMEELERQAAGKARQAAWVLSLGPIALFLLLVLVGMSPIGQE